MSVPPSGRPVDLNWPVGRLVDRYLEGQYLTQKLNLLFSNMCLTLSLISPPSKSHWSQIWTHNKGQNYGGDAKAWWSLSSTQESARLCFTKIYLFYSLTLFYLRSIMS
jgi:hypothetical protein